MVSPASVRSMARIARWKARIHQMHAKQYTRHTEWRRSWLDSPAAPGEWLVNRRVKILDCISSRWHVGVVVRAGAGGSGGRQEQWLVCFGDGPRMESLLPGKWKCHVNDCPSEVLDCTVSKLKVLKGGLTGQGAAGVDSEGGSIACTNSATSANGVS